MMAVANPQHATLIEKLPAGNFSDFAFSVSEHPVFHECLEGKKDG